MNTSRITNKTQEITIFDINDEDSPSKESDPFADDALGQSSAASSSASSALDFDGLYDDETEDRDDRKTRLPVLVCLALRVSSNSMCQFFIPITRYGI
jgi:hypothetical protein